MENETDQESPRSGYILKLYVTGTTPRSARAVVNIRKICEKYLPGGYSLEVIDILQNPEAAKIDQIIAAPTLIKEFPFPSRRFIGDMSRTETIISRLDLPTP